MTLPPREVKIELIDNTDPIIMSKLGRKIFNLMVDSPIDAPILIKVEPDALSVESTDVVTGNLIKILPSCGRDSRPEIQSAMLLGVDGCMCLVFQWISADEIKISYRKRGILINDKYYLAIKFIK